MSYCTKSDIEARFGVSNVEKWADLDNDQDPTKIAARIVVAIETVDAEIDDLLRDGPYLVPLVATGGTMTPTIVDTSARKAGIWLYDVRGSQDTDKKGKPVHKFAAMASRAEQVLNQILAGKRTIQCQRVGLGTNAPFAVPSKQKPRKHA